MNDPESLVYEFDHYRIDAGRRLLTRGGAPVPLKPKVFDTLLYLVSHQGRLLEKDELMRAIWPDTVVEENSLNQCVSTLRRALGESPGENRYIITVPGRGYRFVAIASAMTNGAVVAVATREPVGAPEIARTAEAVVRVPIPPAIPSRWHWVLVGLLAAAFVISLWVGWRGTPPDFGKRAVWLDLDVGSEVSEPAIAPDGTTLVFVANGRLAVRRLDQARITPLAGTDGASSPFFSPDGRWVGYFANHQLRKVALEGGESVMLCDAPRDRGGAWTDDGTIIAALSATGELSSVPEGGGTPRPFSDMKGESSGVTSHSRPVVLPGRKGVLFIAGTGVATGSLRVLPPGGGPAKTLVGNSSNGRYLKTGYLLFNRELKMFAAPLDLDRLELTGTATPFIEGVAYDHFRGADFDVSASGTLIYRRSPPVANRAVMWLDSSGAKRRVFAKTGAYTSPRMSPDGKRLALTSESEVWIYDISREKMTQLTFGSEVACCPLWTPDGDYVMFQSKYGIAWTRSDGSGLVQRLPADRGPFGAPWSFSPKGKWLAYFGPSPITGFDLWAAPVERADGALRLGQALPLLKQPGLQAAPAISPDGRWLTYASDNETGHPEIYVIPFSLQGPPRQGKWPVSTDGGRAPRWSSTGGEIFFRSPDDHLMSALVTTTNDSVRSGQPRVWAEDRLANLGGTPNFDVAPDGKHLVALFDVDERKADETHLRVLLNVNDELRRQRETLPKGELR